MVLENDMISWKNDEFFTRSRKCDYRWIIMIVWISVVSIFPMISSSWIFTVGSLEQFSKPTHAILFGASWYNLFWNSKTSTSIQSYMIRTVTELKDRTQINAREKKVMIPKLLQSSAIWGITFALAKQVSWRVDRSWNKKSISPLILGITCYPDSQVLNSLTDKGKW